MPEAQFKKSYCRFCLSFCGVIIEHDSKGIPIKVSGDRAHPLSQGYTCSKGRSLLSFYSNNRLLFPLKDSKKKKWNQIMSKVLYVIQKRDQNKYCEESAIKKNISLSLSSLLTATKFRRDAKPAAPPPMIATRGRCCKWSCE